MLYGVRMYAHSHQVAVIFTVIHESTKAWRKEPTLRGDGVKQLTLRFTLNYPTGVGIYAKVLSISRGFTVIFPTETVFLTLPNIGQNQGVSQSPYLFAPGMKIPTDPNIHTYF